LELRKSDSGLTLLKSSEAARNIALFAAPLVLLIAAIPWIGLYIAAAIYLFCAIGIIGKIPFIKTFAISLLTPLAMFVLFEFIFRTPLPKGPLGPLLGIL
jgi:putative tricarboxylic transport membrane protein